MTRALEFDKRVVQDVSEIRSYYQALSPHLEAAFEAAFREAVSRLKASPLAYAEVRGSMRRVRLRRFPYSIGYRVEPERILVVGVVHAARDPEVWKPRANEPD
ncbi:MAG: type II toxin-antitoxin system RelE/ParE family toxin [Planctomycetes bacterium]|nr:type II toxin-antitoxin system RelE/ParE family toxin [Planctomycetota bacterium]